ncbi:penicillin-binding protein 1A [Geomonas silvestris]|uniref:Penicillin-binding protein 1A n=1 Tax=Geomonas silvestris TaxID=2740184 RepID=A0A6V8MHV9_9BACT|nr:penicillin-binding protein 1A [Geomonas silvestris]
MSSPVTPLSSRLLKGLALAAFLIVLPLSSAFAEKIANFPLLPAGTGSIRVFDRDGRFAGRILPTGRYWTPINQIPKFLQDALVAVEDSRFYEHNGIDFKGIARALVKDVAKGRMAEGGSTITQQLIKNKFLTGEKTLDRKVKEAQLAMDFEKKYSKAQILEMYFNEINFGNGAWGIAQAARLYFDKQPQELTDAECSLLAGIPKAPGRYNPLGDPQKVALRRSVVLKRMVDMKMISERERQNLMAHPATVIKPGKASYYLAHVKAKLIERFGAGVLEQGGLDVIAAMDLNLQKLAEDTLRDGVRKLSPKLQGALLCQDPATGDVLAAAGGVDFAASPYDRAFLAKRQPGSSVKPLIYAAALEKGFTAATLMNDTPVAYDRGNGQSWTPVNYERKGFGELPLREALAHSNNVIAVKLLDAIGVPYFSGFAGTLGLSLHPQNGLSLALGTDEVTLSQLVSAYSPLASGGLRSEPRTIIRIYDQRRRTWTEIPPAVTPVLAPATAYVTTQMLKDVLTYGTAKGLKKFSQERPAAGKTGTTDDYRDAWFVGYTPQLVTGVWVGQDKPKPGGRGFTGGAVAAPIWGRFMKGALAGKPAPDFAKPETVVTATIDPSTGKLATPECPHPREEFFLPGTEPTEYCPKHGSAPAPPAGQELAPEQELQTQEPATPPDAGAPQLR